MAAPMLDELYGARNLLRQSTNFWDRIDPTGNDSALITSRILFGDAQSTLAAGVDEVRPFAVIMRPPGPMWKCYAGGDRPYLHYSGQFWIYLSDTGVVQSDPKLDFLEFAAWADRVMADIAEVAGTDIGDAQNPIVLLPITQIDLVGGPQHQRLEAQSDDQPRYWQVWYSLTWGIST